MKNFQIPTRTKSIIKHLIERIFINQISKIIQQELNQSIPDN